jgi:hypothetical protein
MVTLPDDEPEVVELDPEEVDPVVINPDVLEPEEVEPEVVEVEPVVVEPEVVNPDVLEPDEVDPVVTNPDVLEPEEVEPEVVEVEPVVVEPEVVNPDVLEPDEVDPVVINPDVLEPEVVPDELDDPSSSVRSEPSPKSNSLSSKLSDPEADFFSPVVKVDDDPPELELLDWKLLEVEVLLVEELPVPVDTCRSSSSSKSTSPDAVLSALVVNVMLEPPELDELVDPVALAPVDLLAVEVVRRDEDPDPTPVAALVVVVVPLVAVLTVTVGILCFDFSFVAAKCVNLLFL